jgi:L-ascorbate metabolism protein UlaG (beta-lactamase superfamily)
MKTMLISLSVLIVFVLVVVVFVNQPKFGKLPSGERLERIQSSPNYQKGSFQNLSVTPDLTEGVSYSTVMWDFLFAKKERQTPTEILPSVKTDLLNLSPEADILVWFGHSSYFMQVDGKKVLMDPVLSGAATPMPFGGKSFAGSDIYTTEDFPEIDILFISHDHWDHLDYDTILKLKPKIKLVICGLGIGAHFEHWGFDPNAIVEMDWNESVDLEEGFSVTVLPARHFSGRGFSRNKALWVSFAFRTPSMNLYLGGDSGYDRHFAEIGNKFGPFDLVILDNGQYDAAWQYVHLMPNEILTAARELNAKRILPVHSSKFVLGNHPWDEPLEKIIANNESEKQNIITPMIGEQVNLNDSTQAFSLWWRKVK